MASNQFSVIKDYQQEILNLPTGDGYIDSTLQSQDIQKAYEKTAYKYDWPQLLKRFGDPIVANVSRYDLQSDFRKFRFLASKGQELKHVEFDNLPFSALGYAVDHDSLEYIIGLQPSSASSEFVLTNTETAGNAVTIELDTVSGLAAGDKIFFDNTTSSEFSQIQSVDSDNTTITAKLSNTQSSGVKLYKVIDINYFQFYKTVSTLSSDTDTPETPDTTHLIIPHYAAYLYFKRLEDKDRADYHYQIWEEELLEAWLAFDKSSTGEATQLII